MNFEELSKIWNQDADEKNSIAINKRLLREVSFSTIRSNLKETKWGSYIQIIINYFWIGFLIDFLLEHYKEFSLLLPTGILILISIYSILFGTYRLVQYYLINDDSTIIKTQKKLEQLKRLEIIDNNSLYFLMPLFFIPFIIVAARAILGIDVYEMGLSERGMIMGTLFTLLISVIIIYYLKKHPNKELTESLNFIRELKDIEKEDH